MNNPVGAGRELLRRMNALEDVGASFAVETTLSSRSYTRRFGQWSALGYHTTLHFIELPSAKYAVDRVAKRVAAGGHSVPEADITRRFHRGLHLFQTKYKPLPDRWYQWFSDDGGLRLVLGDVTEHPVLDLVPFAGPGARGTEVNEEEDLFS